MSDCPLGKRMPKEILSIHTENIMGVTSDKLSHQLMSEPNPAERLQRSVKHILITARH